MLLTIIVAYLLTGFACIVWDFRKPFIDRPAYARRPERYAKGFLVVILGWLPLSVAIASRSHMWGEAAKRVATFGLLSVGGLMITSPANARETGASVDEQHAVASVYLDCLAEQIVLLDDGVSDAMTVGRVVANACRSKREDVAAIMSKGNRRVQRLLSDRLASHAPEDAATFVLQSRSEKSRAPHTDK